MNNSTSSGSASFSYPDIAFSYTLRFWIYLVGNVPSIICSVFVLAQFLSDRTLRQALNNHVIIVLLVLGLVRELTSTSWTLHYYRFGTLWQATPAFCLIQGFCDFALYVTQLLIFAWACIERHILIFHSRWLQSKRQRFVVHYLPLITLLSYCLIFFCVVFFFPPCQNTFFFGWSLSCVAPCLYFNRGFSLWDSLFNQIAPTIVISLFSLALLGRVLWQKRRLRQQLTWTKHRKMAVQLLSISILYIVLYLPFMLIRLAHLLGLPRSVGRDFSLYAVFFSEYVQFLLPFVIAGSLPQLRSRLRRLLWWHNRPQKPSNATPGLLLKTRAVDPTNSVLPAGQ